jgi:hypothetical protein
MPNLYHSSQLLHPPAHPPAAAAAAAAPSASWLCAPLQPSEQHQRQIFSVGQIRHDNNKQKNSMF